MNNADKLKQHANMIGKKYCKPESNPQQKNPEFNMIFVPRLP